MKYMYDVVVVGAGPAGSAAARRCAELGLEALLLEEHATIGSPVQCAGLLSCAAFGECRVTRAAVLNEVRGARILTGGGSELCFDACATKAVVVDRGALDREMARAAADAGAEILLKTSCVRIDGTEVVVKGAGGNRRIPFRLLIGADGPRSIVARSAGFPRPPLFLAGMQAELPHEMDGRYVELYPDASPDFFGWAIPCGEGRARVGLCGAEMVRQRFDAFAGRFDPRRIHLVVGTIPLGAREVTCGHRVMLVGDAAGFAKPTSGGGVYTGVRSGRHAAEVAAECCESGRFDDGALDRYRERWQQDFGRELAAGFRLLRIRRRMGSENVDALCRALNDPDIIATIVRHGDMDRPRDLIRRIVFKPSVLRCMGSVLHSELREIMKS